MKATNWYKYAHSGMAEPFNVTLLTVERIIDSECVEAMFRATIPGIKPSSMKLRMGRAEAVDMARRLLREAGEI